MGCVGFQPEVQCADPAHPIVLGATFPLGILGSNPGYRTCSGVILPHHLNSIIDVLVVTALDLPCFLERELVVERNCGDIVTLN